MKALIYDYETISTDATTAPILTLALYRFDSDRFKSDNPYTMEEVVADSGYYKFNVEEQVVKFGRVIQKSTLDWWSRQDREVCDKQLKPLDSDISVTQLGGIFNDIYVKGDLVVTRGNTFDPIITDGLLKATGTSKEVYPYWVVRDARSIIDGMSFGSTLEDDFIPPDLDQSKIDKHDPRFDIALDVLRIQALAQLISQS